MAYTEGAAYYNNTINGVMRINDKNLSDVEFNDVIQPTALMSILPFRPADQGNQAHWTVQTVAPGVGFRELNAGINNAAAKEKTVTATLKLLDASLERDVATPIGPRMTFEQYFQRESMLSLNAALAEMEYQFIRGTDKNATGWDGLKDLLNIWGTMGLDVGGSGGTRVYMLCLGLDRICGIAGSEQVGQEGNITVSEPYKTRKVDGSNLAYGVNRVDITGWMGLQIAGSYSGAVAHNIDGSSGKTVDDDLLAQLYTKFPTQHAPFVNCILMSRTGLKQLRDSMVTDLIPSPPFPTSWGGAGRQIPIVVSDAVDDSEDANTSS